MLGEAGAAVTSNARRPGARYAKRIAEEGRLGTQMGAAGRDRPARRHASARTLDFDLTCRRGPAPPDFDDHPDEAAEAGREAVVAAWHEQR